MRWSALPLVALGLQIFVLYGPGRKDAAPFSVSALLLLASYGAVLATVLANRQLPGMAWLGLGAALNFLVIFANGGWMPVTAELLAVAGFITVPSAVTPGQRAFNSKDVIKASDEIRLGFLADQFVIPKAGLFSAVFSLGDILMMFGLSLLVYSVILGGEKHTGADSNPRVRYDTASKNR
jgi:hypothetical protein